MHREIGRKIYYIKSTGEVLYDTGELQGYVIETNLEQDLKNGNLETVPRQQIGVLKLDYGEYREHFKNYNFFKVNVANQRLHFYNKEIYRMKLYNEQKHQKKYTEEKIYEFYDTYLNYNLVNAFNLDKVKFNWKTIDELNIRTRILDRSWVTYFKDDYLAESARDRTKLALDILENGTYWPLVTAVSPDDGLLYAYEGNHRVISAKLAAIEGKWPKDKKFLCMELDGYYGDFKLVDNQVALEKPLLQRFPFAGIYDTEAYISEEVRENVMAQMKDDEAIFVDEDNEIVQKQIYTYTEFMHSNQIFPHWLRDILYKFREENGRIIRPNKIINDENEWNKWLESRAGGSKGV